MSSPPKADNDIRPVLATVLHSSYPDASPLGLDLEDLTRHWKIYALTFGKVLRDAPQDVTWLTLEELGLPEPVLRFSLEPGELAVLVKPHFLRHLMRFITGEVLFVSGDCLVMEALNLPTLKEEFSLALFPALPGTLAQAKASTAAALDSGLGEPTGDVLQIRFSPAVSHILTEWASWMESGYVADATASLRSLESRFLFSLPGSHPEVRWNHSGLYGMWSDLHPDAPTPALVGTHGIEEYLAVDQGPSYPLMERRTHGQPVLEHVANRCAVVQHRVLPVCASGSQPSALARSIYRAVDPWGHRWPDPFDDRSPDSFMRWIAAEDAHGLPRYAQALYWARPDLRRSFPASATTVNSFMHWLRSEGVGPTEETPPRLFPAPLWRRIVSAVDRKLRRVIGKGAPTMASGRILPRAALTGVNVTGFARAENGLGEAMRTTLTALDNLGVPRAVVDVSNRIYSRLGPAPEMNTVGAPYELSIFHLNPEELLGYAHDSLSYRLGADWRIGYFFWETDRIPAAWLPTLDALDEVWVGSTFIERAFRRVTAKPVMVMSLAVEPPQGVSPTRSRFGIPAEDFVAMFVTDAYSGITRKNPLGLVEAFSRAFGPKFEGVHLVLKISNLEKFPSVAREIGDAARGMPLTLIGDYLSRRELWDLLACADTYVSLHASEGFGLTILEAMSLGVPVICTAYAGNMDFTTADTALLVGYDLVPAFGGPANIYTGAGHWARPHLEEAVTHLRRLRHDPDLRQLLGERGRVLAHGRYSSAVYSERVGRRLSELGVELPTRAGSTTPA